jgi:hypothetical protein
VLHGIRLTGVAVLCAVLYAVVLDVLCGMFRTLSRVRNLPALVLVVLYAMSRTLCRVRYLLVGVSSSFALHVCIPPSLLVYVVPSKFHPARTATSITV